MKNSAKNLSLVFSAGCLGGVMNSLVVWLFGLLGITALFGVAIAPPLTPLMIFSRTVWGGIWAVLFLIPILQNRVVLRGLVFSIAPDLSTWFVVFPHAGKGLFGLELGTLTPIFVIFFNLVWGITASLWLSVIKEKS